MAFHQDKKFFLSPWASGKLKEKLTQAGLDADYWTSILKSKLKITLPQQIQFLNETHLKELEGCIRQDWEREALKKLLGIQRGSTSLKAEIEGESLIISKLREEGLEAEYWANVLNLRLGITKCEQFVHLTLKDIKKLKSDVRYEWEENALKKLFCISQEPNEEPMMRTHSKENQPEIQNLIKEIDELRKAGIHHNDRNMSRKLERLRDLMSIPKSQWIGKYEAKSCDDLFDKITSDLQGIVDREPMKSMGEILESASGGLALRGVLVGKEFEDDCIKRVVLSTPTDAVQMNAAMQQVDDVASFSSKEQSDIFHKTLDTMGYSAAISVKGKGWGFRAEGDLNKKKDQKHETKSLAHIKIQYESSVKYAVVPTASCELNPHSLKLSKEALQELKTIEKILVGSGNKKLVEKKCKDFLSAFGSHINAGVLHFGGVYKFVSTYMSEIKSTSDQVKSMVRDALTKYASAGYSSPVLSMGGSVSADQLTTDISVTNDYEKSELAKTILQTMKNGGPPEVSSLALWKVGLVSCNSTWALIDRGKSMDFLEIWKLISNHRSEFQKPYELESTLESVWNEMSGYTRSTEQERTLMQGLDAIDQLIEKIARWNSEEILPERCIEFLQEIRDAISEVEAQTGSNKYWADKLCTDENISHFLERIFDLRDQFNPKDSSEIRLLIRTLVNPVGFRKFHGKEKIMKYAEGKPNDPSLGVPSVLDFARIDSIPDLITFLKERFSPALQIEHAKNDEKNEQISDNINAGATRDLALCVRQLLMDLQSSQKTHEMFFLKVVLLSIDYHWPTESFSTLVTMDKLEGFVQTTEVSWKEFQVHKEKGQLQLEGFLIHNLLSSCHFNDGLELSEEKFSEVIKELRQVLSPEVNMVLNRYATNAPFNWIDMKSVLAEVAKGNISATEEKEVNIADLENIVPSQYNNGKDSDSLEHVDSLIAAQDKFKDILNILGLSEYYPSKIRVSDAIAIKKNIECPKLVDIPWMILDKLFMIDFRARDQPFLEVSKSSIQDESNDGDEFELEAHLQVENTDDVGEEQPCLSTLDALVTLFACCDNFLKQIVAQKLFVCKLAIPFLYPFGTEGNICMSMWALRTIIVQSQNMNKEPTEMPVTKGAFPLVSFIRLDRPPFSKSKFLNNILRDDSHNTFFHEDCDNGIVPRQITDGLVECSWFIPAGKEPEHLPRTTMFLNLRGNASLMRRQFQILQEISTVLFLLVSANDLAKSPNTEAFKELLKSNAKLITFLITSSGKKGKEELRDCVNAVGKDFFKGVPILSSNTTNGKRKNASEIRTETRRKLSEVLDGCSGISLEDCARRAKNRGVIIDEYDDEACIEGKKLAEKTFGHMEGVKIEECRDLLLPLQGDIWMEYSKLLKEQQRASDKGSNKSSEFHADQVKQKMDRLRKKQVETCKSRLSPFVKDFISGLQVRHVVMYFLKWMSLFLDEKSRSTLPGIRKEYHTCWTKFQDAKKNGDKESLQCLKLEVDDAEHKLANASLGLENLFRELGQVYEAMKEGGKIGEETRLGVDNLAEIAARLLLHGIPLELVDGDAASIPITWVSAVLGKVENLIGKKKLYVISVLGIQSSGKSTLLNTMFGLQFAVSAGRCTRGAYMQLIPVDEKASLPFHYVAVVDTEGLRAPELGQLKYEHDNELATLGIGLGDVTLINVKGENTAEIKDILQIVVHAFLRMKIVKRQIRENRTCMFIHQNVPAANADELMRHGCQKLKESLDDRAKEAALSEDIADIHSFSQIINFDIEKHVWYFSDLWHGNPPMAPANHGYSAKVNEVRLNLLSKIAEGKTFLTASELSIRLGDLWEGVLADDFVFSFRNSLEVKAYNSLQSKYYTLEWELQNEWKSWSHDAEIKLKRCEALEELESSYRSLVLEIPTVLMTKADEIRDSLENYFETCDMRDIIIQWQQPKMNQLEISVQEQQTEGRRDLLSIKEARRVEILHARKWSKHEGYIMNKAVELADELKGKTANDAELEERFNHMWVSMVNELTTKTEDKELKMHTVMEEILYQRMHDQGPLLRKELRNNRLTDPPPYAYLESSLTKDFVKKEHISLKTTSYERSKVRSRFDKFTTGAKSWIFGNNTAEDDAVYRTMILTGSILKEIGTELRGLTHDMKFQKSHATDIIKKLVDRIDSHNHNAQKSDDCKFTILPDYVVKLAVYVSRYCVQVFTSIQLEYSKKHGVKAKLQAYRAKAWSLFKNKVKDATEEVSAGDLLCTHLKEIVQKAVRKATPRKCTDEILRDFQRNKYYMLVRIMDDLAVKGNFKRYMSFIHNAKDFALEWLTEYADEKLFSLQNGSDMSRYEEITKNHIVVIMQCISNSVSHATSVVEGKRSMQMALWIEQFCDRVSEQIAVPVSDLSLVTERLVMDFNNFQRVIFDQLDRVQKDLENTFVNESPESVDWDGSPPSQQVLDKIWGCTEQCPFCKEPCADTTPNHNESSGKSHMCVQHRPKGLAGISWNSDSTVEGEKYGKNELSVHSCNYAVQLKDISFNCGACRKKCRDTGECSATGTEQAWHKYAEYKTFLPEWDIAPDRTNGVSKYWTWFMATYQHQLKDWYKAKLPSIPESWRLVTKEEALEDLRKIHH